jgi:DNA-binding CsgD family transcriptional regulator
LKISVLTVKTHRKNILRKLNADNSLQMIRIAFEKGLI